MFEGLDEIDWEELNHAYGSAGDVPDQLRGLASEDEVRCREAMYACWQNIWHQGTVYEATAYTVPFLVALAAAPEVQVRKEILNLLVHIANGSSYHDVHQHLPHSGERTRQHPDFEETLARELGWVERARAAVAAGAPTYLDLLDDPDPEVWGWGISLLTRCERTLAPFLPGLRDRFAIAQDAYLAAAMLKLLFAFDEENRRSLVDPAVSDPRPLVRFVAALSQASLVAEPLPESLSALLLDALDDRDPLHDYYRLPFSAGVVGDAGRALVRSVPHHRERTALRLLQAFEALGGAVADAGRPLLDLSFPEPMQQPRLEQLTAFQRRVLTVIARYTWSQWPDGAWITCRSLAQAMDHYGLTALGAELAGYDGG